MRRVTPQTSYDEHERYPSAIDAHLSRRGFLRAALTSSAAAGVTLVAGQAAVARKRRPAPHKTAVTLRSRYRFKYGNYEVQRIIVQTRSGALVRFIKDPKEAAGIEKALRKVMDAHSCVDLRSGKKLSKLQRRLASALAARYKKRRKATVATPTVVLFVGVPGVSCRGDCAPPTPICKPPPPRRRR